MLEKPELQDDRIAACLRDEYGLRVARVSFLPLGADENSAVYRVTAQDDLSYFLKLRSGPFDETPVALTRYLSDEGIEQVIAPLTTTTGRLWTEIEGFTATLYPYVEGQNGFQTRLTHEQWREFGRAVRRLHATIPSPSLRRGIPSEAYSPRWRDMVRMFLDRVEEEHFEEPVAGRVATLLKRKRGEIQQLVRRATQLASEVQDHGPAHVLCHSDLHAGNILVDAQGAFYIVDWDAPILAPKERDLMFIGGAQGFRGYSAREEETLFFQGYGETEIDPSALAYYRYERIIEDIAIYCQALLLTEEGGEDREQSYRYLASNFLPGGTIEAARRVDRSR